MKNTLKIFLVMLLSVALIACFASCSKTSEESADSEDVIEEVEDDNEAVDNVEEYDDSEEVDNGIVFEEESEGAVLEFKEATADDFVGSWSATSGQSVYMYGNVDIIINSDGSWEGNIAEEEVKGTWELVDSSARLSSDLVNASLSFTEDGKLIMQEDRGGDGELINTVLSKN